ncbi:hypothetical protein HNR02_003308 [Amycolatopsis endophytica]|uniref:Uncharacterized protein n=1 Tax=Amycolatopsis endophytica TaxID=860233 RepID=A0A853B5A1_9PSEU|nr:hypothetical protein [Amycolatopsis endophytica]
MTAGKIVSNISGDGPAPRSREQLATCQMIEVTADRRRRNTQFPRGPVDVDPPVLPDHLQQGVQPLMPVHPSVIPNLEPDVNRIFLKACGTGCWCFTHRDGKMDLMTLLNAPGFAVAAPRGPCRKMCGAATC